MSNNVWDNVYKDTPLEEIPWRSESAPWLYQFIEDKTIPVGTVLDLGCGTGEKSIYLAKEGFNVVGVDISKTAIKHAREFADKAGVKVEFYNKDATNLSFLKDKTFDFVLDFANLHGIAKEKQPRYVQEIAKHLKPKGLFFLRCFSKRTPNRDGDYFVGEEVGDWKIWYFSKEDIISLFGNDFKILKTHQEDFKTPIRDIYFDEYLMERFP
jgi:2-polyprenyl-3-methyl-5-hydroxy-6-metoxy-1,4-benzoquinol methylase